MSHTGANQRDFQEHKNYLGFYFKTPTKRTLVFFRTKTEEKFKLAKILVITL